jgi:hypothetical protein
VEEKMNVGSSHPLVIDVCTCFSLFCEDYRSYVVLIPLKRVLSSVWMGAMMLLPVEEAKAAERRRGR